MDDRLRPNKFGRNVALLDIEIDAHCRKNTTVEAG